MTRVLFLLWLSRNFNDQLSSNFHRFVIYCICWDIASEKTGLWQLPIVSNVCQINIVICIASKFAMSNLPPWECPWPCWKANIPTKLTNNPRTETTNNRSCLTSGGSKALCQKKSEEINLYIKIKNNSSSCNLNTKTFGLNTIEYKRNCLKTYISSLQEHFFLNEKIKTCQDKKQQQQEDMYKTTEKRLGKKWKSTMGTECTIHCMCR